MKNLRKNENGGQRFKPIAIDKLETDFKGLLTENRERYLRKQDFAFGLNEIGMDTFNLDIEIVKMSIKPLKSNTSCGSYAYWTVHHLDI